MSVRLYLRIFHYCLFIIFQPDTSNTTGGLCRKVRVSMFFGRSEVKVVATEKISRKRYETSIKFE